MGKVKTNFKTRRKIYIREWRKHRGLTLERLADRIDVSAGLLSQIERGDTNYTRPMLEALADALNCEPGDLIMRNPTDRDFIWSIWETLSSEQRKQAVAVIKAIKATGTDG